jgi:hypothetical protein
LAIDIQVMSTWSGAAYAPVEAASAVQAAVVVAEFHVGSILQEFRPIGCDKGDPLQQLRDQPSLEVRVSIDRPAHRPGRAGPRFDPGNAVTQRPADEARDVEPHDPIVKRIERLSRGIPDGGIHGQPYRKSGHRDMDAERDGKRARRPLVLRVLEKKSNFRRCVCAQIAHVVKMGACAAASNLFCALIFHGASCKTNAIEKGYTRPVQAPIAAFPPPYECNTASASAALGSL